MTQFDDLHSHMKHHSVSTFPIASAALLACVRMHSGHAVASCMKYSGGITNTTIHNTMSQKISLV